MRVSSGFWQGCRVLFRRLRRLAMLALVVLVCIVVWLNQIGLPDFLKRPLVETLRTRGIELEFARLRLSLRRGLVADNVRVGRAEKAGGPVFLLQQVQLRLDYHALLHRQWQLKGLVLRQGRFTWPLSHTNTLVLDHVQADLRFQANDTWSLDNFQADFAGAKLTCPATSPMLPPCGIGKFSTAQPPTPPRGGPAGNNLGIRCATFILPARRN